MAVAIASDLMIMIMMVTLVSMAEASPITSFQNLSPRTTPSRHNIVFLIDESTDGRSYRPDFRPMHLTNIRKLTAEPQVVQFDTHYVTAPVCCVSRASIWSGRYPHQIKHLQKGTNIPVDGAWNNFEGLPDNYSQKINDVLANEGYDVSIAGKTDWSTGGHSLDNRLEAWAMYIQFPYNASTGGFYDETLDMCPGNGTVAKGTTPSEGGYYSGDWKALNTTVAWIKDRAAEQSKLGPDAKPFFAYQGMNIVHPAYFTNEYWYSKVNQSAVTAPAWKPLSELHPCDFQASMLKGCIPANETNAEFVYSIARRKRVRSIYYAMILEFDSMVGAYMDVLDETKLTDNTILIVTSDHGDMNMEHQQFYKMVQYDASARVPLVIRMPPGSPAAANAFVKFPTSHLDLFPTIMDLAQVPVSHRPSVLQGESLAPFLPSTPATRTPAMELLDESGQSPTKRRAFSVIQFHGCDIAMSWFSIVDGTYKYNIFGSGAQHPAQLFNMLDDPEENNNIAAKEVATVKRLDALMRTVVDYPSVALDVANYNHESLATWINNTANWKTIIAGGRWKVPFNINTAASIKAIETYIAAPPQINKCRGSNTWPTSA